ncbi:hypothetical protein WJX74_005268 [Apatococcus lobatus]|uniref:DOT1 domain-containing protein n=1 Tax=Apatococcus lobatus TaxID=904363 RepID=A0AAW1QMY3_9CHLO
MAPDILLEPAVLQSVDKRVRSLYYIMQSVESNLGGGEGLEGIYGTLTRHYMQLVLDALETHCGLAASSSLIDVGSGLGRPLMHACVSHGLTACHGIEIDFIKCAKANAFVALSAQRLKTKMAGPAIALPSIQCCPIEEVPELTASHVFSFWEGIPTQARCALGRLVAASPSVQGVAVCQRAMRGGHPEAVMQEMGFGSLKLVETFPVSMAGRGQRFVAYIFSRNAPAGKAAKVSLPFKSPTSAAVAAAPASRVKSPPTPSLSKLSLWSPTRSPKRKPPPSEGAAGSQTQGSPPKKPARDVLPGKGGPASAASGAAGQATAHATSAVATASGVAGKKAAQAPASAARLRHALAASRIPLSPAASSASKQQRPPSVQSTSPPSAIPSPPPLQTSAVLAQSLANPSLQNGQPAAVPCRAIRSHAMAHLPTGPLPQNGHQNAQSSPSEQVSKARQPTRAAAARSSKPSGVTTGQARRAATPGREGLQVSPPGRTSTRQTRLMMHVTKDLGGAQVHAVEQKPASRQDAQRDKNAVGGERVAAVAAASHKVAGQPATAAIGSSLSRSGCSRRVTRQGSTRLAAAAAAANNSTSKEQTSPHTAAALRPDALHDSTNALPSHAGQPLRRGKTVATQAAQSIAADVAAEQIARIGAGAKAGKVARANKITATFQQRKKQPASLQGQVEKLSGKGQAADTPSYGLGSGISKQGLIEHCK